ncbi:MAG TPA: heme exporter protein CcmD [Burkholderiales bacterium]|nr:heme exporter protein CcmD [Burkholderiales bacterium]
MNWTSWNDFFAMGGYALYVWGSYAVTFALIAVEVVLVRRRRRVALRDARTLRVSEGGAP